MARDQVSEEPPPLARGVRARSARARASRLALGAMLLATLGQPATAQDAGSAASLREAYAKHRVAMDQNKFGVPLHLESSQTPDALQGDIHALLDQPFEKVQAALAVPENWCDILILHPNVKGCRLNAGTAGGDASITVKLGRSETPVDFSYKATRAPNYLDVRLGSPTGPFGTTDYRIRLEVAPADGQHTILHLRYSHRYGFRAKLAMQAYFGTLGRGKVGFSVTGTDAQGQPTYVSDLRGGLERNAMRYYASIESYLFALSAPAQEQLERRLKHWYEYTERYPLQLQEEPGYLDLKRNEARRVSSTEKPR